MLGAFDGERLVGYTLAIVGFRDGTVFLHSHMTGVLESIGTAGVGRALKLFQREEALGRGIRLIVWTFDPLETRNAHFNLNRLGAIARKYLPNLYGVTTSPLHRGLATDRLWAEWQLDSARVVAAISELAEGAEEAPATIELPNEVESGKESDASRSGKSAGPNPRGVHGVVCARIRSGGPDEEGEPETAYQLVPWSDF